MQGIVTVGDYDGVVSQVHVASGHLVADVDEHDGRRCDVFSACDLGPFECEKLFPSPHGAFACASWCVAHG